MKKTRSFKWLLLVIIRLIGILSIYFAIKELFMVNSGTIEMNIAAAALFYLIFSPLVVTLPSGANWRPGMAFILFAILNFDYKLVILVAIPGTLLASWGKKVFMDRFFLTIGHLTIGIYAAGIVREWMNVEFTATLVSYLAITICLLFHFLFNRLVAALIVSYHKQRSFLRQVYLLRNDLNWGYSCAYILGILMFLIFRVYGFPGIFLVMLLLITIYQAFTYFQKLKAIEEKVYLDVLTGAENRMSWEVFQNQLEDEGQNRSGIVFMMDLDHFKMINDTYGHNFGDQILKDFVNYVKEKMTREYRLFRYGGDEFIMVVATDVEEYSKVDAEVSKILYLQNECCRNKELNVSISFGKAYLSERDSIVNIVRKADKLMYMNKFGKNMATSIHGS